MKVDPRTVNLLILDMDNTLYDWIDYFVPAIYAMLPVAARLLNVDDDTLREDLRAVHVAHRNTEQPFALLETRAVDMRFPDLSRREKHDILKPAFDAFNEVRKQRLRLYPGVHETLAKIKATGCRLFGHTEATEINISTRLRALGLSQFLEAVYAVPSDGTPHPVGDDRAEQPDRVPVYVMPPTARKPDPRSLYAVLAGAGISAEYCAYVGDSMTKDVAMAKRAGVIAAWARYGVSRSRQMWLDLVKVSHWDPSAVVTADIATPQPPDIQPDVILDSFEQLLDNFRFSKAQLSLVLAGPVN
jgi:phosphoglycolate phosphatase-like HAD superfamily hydrolase